jgi:hypothetical protein
MITLNTPPARIWGKSLERVYSFLADLKNHQYLMPPEVHGFEATTDTCAYIITGTGPLSLKIKDRIENALVSMVPNGKVPFEFEFVWKLSVEGENVIAEPSLNADLNMIMRAIAAKPLTNFIAMQAANLESYFAENN